MKIPSAFKSKAYETRVFLLAVLLGILRMIVAVVMDLVHPPLLLPDFLTDCGLLILFIVFFYKVYALKESLKSIHLIFGIILTLLIAFNFVQYNGIYGFPRFNYYCAIFAVCVIYQGKRLIVLVTFQMVLLIVLAYATANKQEWVASLSLGENLDPSNFLFALVVIATLAFNLKASTQLEVKTVNDLNAQLSYNVEQANQTNTLLSLRTQELQEAQQHMEYEINKRTHALSKQQEAIEIYVQMNTKVIHDPIEALGKVMTKLPTDHILSTMMMASQMELQEVLNTIRHTLDSKEELSRNKIRTP